MVAIQLEFDSIGLSGLELENYMIRKEVKVCHNQVTNLRRGFFGRYAEVEKRLCQQQVLIDEMREEIKKLKNKNA